MRVFFANRKDDEDVDAKAAKLAKLFKAEFPERTVKVTSGKDDFLNRANDLGGWKVWTDDVIFGMIEDENNGEQLERFTHMIVPDRIIGKATADMINGFIAEGKQVIYWDGNVTCAAVTGLEESGNMGKGGKPDWKNGWQLVLARVSDR